MFKINIEKHFETSYKRVLFKVFGKTSSEGDTLHFIGKPAKYDARRLPDIEILFADY